jgi:hypothetical protein
MMKKRLLFLVLCSILLIPSYATAKLIGVSWSLTNSPVVTINEATGTGSTLGPSGFAFLNSLTKDGNGVLYSVSDSKLIKIDPATGLGTLVVTLNFGATPPNVRGLAFSPTPTAATLFAINCRPGTGIQPHDLYVINIATGVGSLIGPNGDGFVVQDIAFSPTGVLYGWDVNKGLVTINMITGAATAVNPLSGGTPNIQSIVFAPDGTLYGAGNGLYKINPTTGAYVMVGSGDYSDVRGIAVIPDPGTLIGVHWDISNSSVVKIDPNTGSGSNIGLSGFPGLNSLAKDPMGTLWSVTNIYDDPNDRLITINPATGIGTQVATLNFPVYPASVRALAFSPSGVLYATNCRPGTGLQPIDLYTVNVTTGNGTYIGPTGAVQGLAFSSSGALYGWDVNVGLVTINTATGAATDVNPAVPGTPDIQSINFALDGTLYGAGKALYKIDQFTGVYTLIGSGGYTDVRGIEFVPVTRPSTMIGVSWESNNSPVVKIDPNTGSGSHIGLSGFPGLNSLAKDPLGTLWSATNIYDDPNDRLIKINPSTGTGTQVATLNFPIYPASVRALAFSSMGVLYATNCRPGVGLQPIDLYTVDVTTGNGTYIGPTGAVQGLAFSSSGALYGWDVNVGLVTINPTSGAAIDVNPAAPGTADIQSIVFASDGTLYGAGKALYKIDKVTGVYTLIGSGGYTDVRGIEFVTDLKPSCIIPAIMLLLD